MNWLEMSESEILAIANPIMDNLMQASTDIDHARHVRDFTEKLKSIITKQNLEAQCKEYQAKLGYFSEIRGGTQNTMNPTNALNPNLKGCIQVRKYYELPEDIRTGPEQSRLWENESKRIASKDKKPNKALNRTRQKRRAG